jgi:hypothetical protein
MLCDLSEAVIEFAEVLRSWSFGVKRVRGVPTNPRSQPGVVPIKPEGTTHGHRGTEVSPDWGATARIVMCPSARCSSKMDKPFLSPTMMPSPIASATPPLAHPLALDSMSAQGSFLQDPGQAQLRRAVLKPSLWTKPLAALQTSPPTDSRLPLGRSPRASPSRMW